MSSDANSAAPNIGLLASLALLGLLLPLPVTSQVSGGAITGTVTDQSGAIVLNATVVVKNLGTGVSQTVASNASGYYDCLLYTSPSPRDGLLSRMPSSA